MNNGSESKCVVSSSVSYFVYWNMNEGQINEEVPITRLFAGLKYIPKSFHSSYHISYVFIIIFYFVVFTIICHSYIFLQFASIFHDIFNCISIDSVSLLSFSDISAMF